MKGNGQPRSARAQASKAEAKAREAGGEALEAEAKAREAGGERKREPVQEESSTKERGPVGERLDRLCSLTSRKRDPEARRRAHPPGRRCPRRSFPGIDHQVLLIHRGPARKRDGRSGQGDGRRRRRFRIGA